MIARKIFGMACLLIGHLAAAESSSPILRTLHKPYLSGPELLEKVGDYPELHYPEMKNSMIGEYSFIDVPLDYDNPSSGTMKLFYRLPKPLDPKKPTVLFFYGGPGGNSSYLSFETQLSGFNFIYFDQRGTAFSHLPTFEDQKNPKFFSSEFIARDAERLITHLNQKKVSVWGHSYGTVVGTIFSHLFSERVTALVLEGVVLNGFPELWTAPHRIKILQRFFNSLLPEQQARILKLSDGTLVTKEWFSKLARSKMYENDSLALFRKKLNQLLELSDEEFKKAVNLVVSNPFMYEDSLIWGAYMYLQISCQELSKGDPRITWNAYFKDGKLVPAQDPDQDCLQIPGMSERMNRTYDSIKYPLKMPVTYFQGTVDGATTAVNAVKHFKKVAQSKSQLVLLRNGGHSPVNNCMSSGEISAVDCSNKAGVVEMLADGLLGKKLQSSQVKAAGPDWTFTKKNW